MTPSTVSVTIRGVLTCVYVYPIGISRMQSKQRYIFEGLENATMTIEDSC